MRNKRIKFKVAILIVCSLATLGFAKLLLAQSTDGTDSPIRLYVDPATHIVYTVPGRGRRLLTVVPTSALSTQNLEQRQDEADQKLDQERARIAELQAQNEMLQSSTEALNKQVADIKPAWTAYTSNFQDKFRIGTLFYRRLQVLHAHGLPAAGADSAK